jgi:hypothetical protein
VTVGAEAPIGDHATIVATPIGAGTATSRAAVFRGLRGVGRIHAP